MFLLINKPKGMTSHDVVDKIRKITGIKKVGHAGTLDPNATGLLIVAVGRNSTKRLEKLLHLDKTYVAEATLGEKRDTDDIEGKTIYQHKVKKIYSIADIKNALKLFIGEQMQIPPQFSAIKLHGKKAYQLARSGKKVKLKPRSIKVYSIKIRKYTYPKLIFEAKVSGGTYIRSIARDLGDKLGCGAYLSNLRRTKIDKFDIRQSVNMDVLDMDNWKNYVQEV